MTAIPRPASSQRSSWLGNLNRHVPAVLLTPAVIALLVLTLYPLVAGLRLSLIDYDLLSTTANGHWNWFRNYIDLAGNREFWNAVRITLVYTVSAVAVELVVGFGLALLLTQELPGRGIVRTAIVSAMVMTPVIVGTAWRLMFNPGWGLLSYLLQQLGFPPHAYLAEVHSVIPALVVVDVWEWSPLIMLILLAGLQSLPVEPFEAAEVDGASPFQAFRYITLPLLKPSIAIALLMRSMDCLRTFDTIFAMTGGGPGTVSQNLNILSYQTGLAFYHISSASAIAVVTLVIITIICNLIMRAFGVELWKSQR